MTTDDHNTTLDTTPDSGGFVDGPMFFPFPELPEGYLDREVFESLELGFGSETHIRLYAEGDEVPADEVGLAVENMPLKLVKVGDEAVSGTRFAPTPISVVRRRDDVATTHVTAESLNEDGRTLSFIAGTDHPILCADTSQDEGMRLFWCPAIGISDEMKVVTNLALHVDPETPDGPPHVHLEVFNVVSNYHNGRIRTIETCVEGSEQTMMVGDIITPSF